MKLAIFNRTKYIASIERLEARKAPTYVIEAYKEGYTNTVNEYYKLKVRGIRKKEIKNESARIAELKTLEADVNKVNISFINEALSQSDLEFLKAFFVMTNMDIISGDKLPPNASKLIKQGIVKDLGLKDLYKKLR